MDGVGLHGSVLHVNSGHAACVNRTLTIDTERRVRSDSANAPELIDFS
jgi:hypothetical protein